MTKLKIKVTKEVLKTSMWCNSEVGANCAIACAVRGVWPKAWVTPYYIILDKSTENEQFIALPSEASDFIFEFDSFEEQPQARLLLPELEFEVEVPDELINQINIDDIIKSSTLELV